MGVFNEIYETNYWNNNESVSGHGSTLAATSALRSRLPQLFRDYGIRRVLDVGCGDMNWWHKMDFPHAVAYLGVDIVPQIIEINRVKWGETTDTFEVMDITKTVPPRADLIFVRDVLGHLSNAEVKQALDNIRKSRSTFLMATTFPHHDALDLPHDIPTGAWRPINLDQMWGLPRALEYINERCVEGDGEFADKSMGLWRLR